MTNEKAGPREESKVLPPPAEGLFFLFLPAYRQMRANWRI